MHEEREKKSKSSGDACLTLLSIKSDQLSEEMLGTIQK